METPKRWGGHPPPEMDDTPLEMPLGARRPTPLADIIANSVRLAIEAEKRVEMESPEEADDFSEEDPETLDLSAYELDEIQSETAISNAELAPPAPQPDPAAAPKATPETGDAPDPNEPEPS